jgi:type II secretory pathway component PulJ
MKPGFVLLDVLLGAAIAALLGSTLFMALYQTNRSTAQLDSIIDRHSAAMLALTQVSRDLSGLFVPIQAQAAEKQEKKQETAEQKQPLQKVFYAVNKDDLLQELTFITNNPLKQYPRGDTGRVTPRSVRVVYHLVPDMRRGSTKKAYKLERQESIKLERSAFNPSQEPPIKAYTILDNIKSLAMTYAVDVNQKEKKEKQRQIKTLSTWNDLPDGPQSELRKKGIFFPDLVTITLVLWDNQQKRTQTFSYAVALASDGSSVPAVAPASPAPQQSKQQTATPQQPTLIQQQPPLIPQQPRVANALTGKGIT